jgi:hypothetical protein
MGRVARVPGTGLPKGERRRKRRHEGGRGDRERQKRRIVMMTWSAVLGLIALVAITVALVLWLRQNMQRPVAAAEELAPGVVLEERVVSEFESPSEQEALDLVKSGLAASDPAEVRESFRLGSASPEEVLKFLNGMEEADGPVDGMIWLSSMDANGLLIDGVAVRTRRDGKYGNRIAMLTPDENGKWRIDFDAFARTAEPSWNELLEGKVDTGLVRVMVAGDTYFNGPFSDDSKWACYGMITPDSEVMMLGYCRNGSPQEAALARIIAKEAGLPGAAKSSKRATLKIRHVEGAEARQFEIVRVMADDWVVSDVPFDTNFE